MQDTPGVHDQGFSAPVPLTAQPPAGVSATAPVDADGFRTVPDQVTTAWPPGVPYIVGNEACERFSFYGMKTILQVHLTTLFAVQAYVQAAADPGNT